MDFKFAYYKHDYLNTQMRENYLLQAFLILCLCMVCSCQVGRDIVMDFLKLDKDNDYLLTHEEITELFPDHPKSQSTHVNLPVFKSSIYPLHFWKQFDENKDSKIGEDELTKIIEEKWSIYSKLWPEGHTNLLNVLNSTQFMKLCDYNKDGVLQPNQFPACLHAVLTVEQQRYPHKIKSMFYTSPNVGYEIEQFKRLLPKFGAETEVVEKYIKSMFRNFEWDNNKIATDHDEMIGPEEGKIMEPLVVLMYLDKSHDGELSKEQALFILKKYGGESAFKIADKNADNKLDRYQFMSYYNFASCIDCKSREEKEREKQHKQNKERKQRNEESEQQPEEKQEDEEDKKDEDKREHKSKDNDVEQL